MEGFLTSCTYSKINESHIKVRDIDKKTGRYYKVYDQNTDLNSVTVAVFQPYTRRQPVL